MFQDIVIYDLIFTLKSDYFWEIKDVTISQIFLAKKEKENKRHILGFGFCRLGFYKPYFWV